MDINTIRIPSKGIRMFLGIAILMKMSNMLLGNTDCVVEQVEISQASDGALGPSIKNSFPGLNSNKRERQQVITACVTDVILW